MPLGETITENGETFHVCSECEGDHTYVEDAEACCSHVCHNCGGRHSSEESAEECCAFFCEQCDARHYYQEDAENCCAEVYYCAGCGGSWDHMEDAYNCCSAGVRDHPQYAPPGHQSNYPEEIRDLVPEYLLAVPDIDGRPTRTCSVEQELSSGGRAVARLLYDLNYSEYDRIMEYGRDARPQMMIVKSDSSLPPGGGEAVYSRMTLSNPENIERLSKAIACVREMKKAGLVTTTRSAGLHIHIGAVDLNMRNVFGPAQMAALYEIFSFSESVLFKLASAGWHSHRGDTYSTKLEKFAKGEVTAGRIAIGSRRHRHYALNFQRLLNAAQSCNCGACTAGDWDACECGVLANGTIEWRVFNATTKPETLHAWLLLAHGLTAAAFTHQLGTLEPNSFDDPSTNPDSDPWILGWILNNCPFANSEKQAIIDLAKRAPGLDVDWDDFERNAVYWGLGQTEMLDSPQEIEDDDVAPPVEVFTPPQVSFDAANATWQVGGITVSPAPQFTSDNTGPFVYIPAAPSSESSSESTNDPF